MDLVSFLSKYQKSLQQRMDDITTNMSSGGAKDMEAYRAMCGEIQGISYALNELHTLLKKANYVEDIDST
jgi:hypothetical protein|tara:strand:+ start:480 stop:689 length:210 start_codon:yes stop_codon:yes gene_type:complete